MEGRIRQAETGWQEEKAEEVNLFSGANNRKAGKGRVARAERRGWAQHLVVSRADTDQLGWSSYILVSPTNEVTAHPWGPSRDLWEMAVSESREPAMGGWGRSREASWGL